MLCLAAYIAKQQPARHAHSIAIMKASRSVESRFPRLCCTVANGPTANTLSVTIQKHAGTPLVMCAVIKQGHRYGVVEKVVVATYVSGLEPDGDVVAEFKALWLFTFVLTSLLIPAQFITIDHHKSKLAVASNFAALFCFLVALNFNFNYNFTATDS